jgi:hypothetical protein
MSFPGALGGVKAILVPEVAQSIKPRPASGLKSGQTKVEETGEALSVTAGYTPFWLRLSLDIVETVHGWSASGPDASLVREESRISTIV